MRSFRFMVLGLAALAAIPWPSPARGAEPPGRTTPATKDGGVHRGATRRIDEDSASPSDCTSCRLRTPCVPECRSSWDEKKVKKPSYSMLCEYACARAPESWGTGPAECRCSPPCGRVYVRKRLFREEREHVERVPKYEVKLVPAPPCDCDDCRSGRRLCWWDPLGLLACLWGR